MRFYKGSKVEVLSKTNCVAGSWFCGEIISGNGRTYSVRFERFPSRSDAVVHKVSRKVIRPRPPHMEEFKYWVSGDLVQVFEGFCWRSARVLKVIDERNNNYLVRLLACPTMPEIRVHGSHIRVRQCWEDGKWFFVGQGSKSLSRTPVKKRMDKQYAGEDCSQVKNNIENLDHQMVSMIKRKRASFFGSTYDHPYPVAPQKRRRRIDGGWDCLMVPRHEFSSDDKRCRIIL